MTNIEKIKAKTVEELAENILMYTNSSFRDYTFCCNSWYMGFCGKPSKKNNRKVKK